MKTHQANGKILAPELQTVGWLNTPEPMTLASLRGKVVLLHAFQMLCPGCVQMGIPQTQRIEHHSVMGREALEVFAYEYRLRFPIGIDKPNDQHVIPHTMMTYQMQGTPTTILIDKTGHLRMHKFGHVSDFILGVSIGTLLAEEVDETEQLQPAQSKQNEAESLGCGPDGCAV
jgi:hypothetical protein